MKSVSDGRRSATSPCRPRRSGQDHAGRGAAVHAPARSPGSGGSRTAPPSATSTPRSRSAGISVSLALAPFEWKGHKVNLLDTPGLRRLRRRRRRRAAGRRPRGVRRVRGRGRRGADRGRRGSSRADLGVPRMIFVNKLDRERAASSARSTQLRDKFGAGVAPLQLPDRRGGRVPRRRRPAHRHRVHLRRDGTPHATATIPDEMDDAGAPGARHARRGHRRRRRRPMERYLADEMPVVERARAHARRRASPTAHGVPGAVRLGASTGVGVDRLADFICEIGPSPPTARPSRCTPATPSRGQARRRRASRWRSCSRRSSTRTSASCPCSRCCRARSSPTTTLVNPRIGRRRAAARPVPCCAARSRTPVTEVAAGDIAAVAKLADTAHRRHAGARRARRSTVAAARAAAGRCSASRSKPARRPTRTSSRPRCTASRTKTRRCVIERNDETHQTRAAGHGRDAPRRSRSRSWPASSASRSRPRTCGCRTARRSRGTAEAEGKYKKQTGGHGQFGVAWLRVEPQRARRGLRVRRQDRRRRDPPPVHPRGREGHRRDDGAGRRATASRSSTCGSSCFDGKYHPVDSSEMSFKMAGLARLQGGDGQGRRRSCSSRSRCSWSPCPRRTRATSWATSTPSGAASRAPSRVGDGEVEIAGARADVGDPALRHRPALDDRRPRPLHRRALALRPGARAPRRQGQAAGRDA